MGLEFCYQHRYRMWQKPLELREVLEPIVVHVYNRKSELPSGTNDTSFDRENNVLLLVRDRAGR